MYYNKYMLGVGHAYQLKSYYLIGQVIPVAARPKKGYSLLNFTMDLETGLRARYSSQKQAPG